MDPRTRSELVNKAELYDAAKDRIMRKIQDNVGMAIEKLRAVERELLYEVEIELGENPFAKLLGISNSDIPPPPGIVAKVLAKKIPEDFGPNEELFSSLHREIEALKSWRKEREEVHVQEKPTQHITETTWGINDWKSAWKPCPDNLKVKYAVNKKDPMIATKVTGGIFGGESTIIGDTPLPLNRVISWNIKVLKSWHENGNSIWVGVAPSDINLKLDFENYKKSGWHLSCFESTLYSGLPHKYKGKKYGPRKEEGKYVSTGSKVGVVMDTAKGELSFILDGVNLGIAYERIPLDKPLVPCVILGWKDDSVELVI